MNEQFIRISEFAELSGIPRKNLIEYDSKGILKPAFVDPDNQYRYYTFRQLDNAMIIKMLRELDMSLKEIRDYIEKRSPSAFIQLCENQKQNINKKVKKLLQMDMVLDAHISKTQEGMALKGRNICQKECGEERIFYGNLLPPLTAPVEIWNHFSQFLRLCAKYEIPTGYPSGVVIDQSELRRDKVRNIKYFYCKIPHTVKADRTIIKPAGRYVMGYDSEEYSFSNTYYNKIFAYIEENFLTVNGDGYEFYLFDELSFLEPDRYLVQIAIPVK